jgi:hypothetical protein
VANVAGMTKTVRLAPAAANQNDLPRDRVLFVNDENDLPIRNGSFYEQLGVLNQVVGKDSFRVPSKVRAPSTEVREVCLVQLPAHLSQEDIDVMLSSDAVPVGEHIVKVIQSDFIANFTISHCLRGLVLASMHRRVLFPCTSQQSGITAHFALLLATVKPSDWITRIDSDVVSYPTYYTPAKLLIVCEEMDIGHPSVGTTFALHLVQQIVEKCPELAQETRLLHEGGRLKRTR